MCSSDLNTRSQAAESTNAAVSDVLTDEQLASQRVAQAAKMKLEAQAMLAEAARLEAEAASFTPAAHGKTTTKKATRKKQAA